MKQDSKDPVSRVTKEIKVQVGVKELLGILEKKESMEIRGTLGVLVRCVLYIKTFLRLFLWIER